MGKELIGELELNRVYQRDCIEGMRMLPDKSVDMVLTDIPYGEVNRAKDTGLRKLTKGNADTFDLDMSELLLEFYRVSNGSVYIFCGFEQVSEIRRFFRERGMLTRICVWEKTNPSPVACNYHWMSSVELCVYAKKKGATFNDHYKSCVWRNPVGRSKVHPTQKPIKLFQYLIETSSNEGDVILDPFLGSGTTAVASARLGRKYIGFEREPEYIEIANKRLDNEVTP
jgi:site-specific DNA-methyltransferase (adenine-specific)